MVCTWMRTEHRCALQFIGSIQQPYRLTKDCNTWIYFTPHVQASASKTNIAFHWNQGRVTKDWRALGTDEAKAAPVRDLLKVATSLPPLSGLFQKAGHRLWDEPCWSQGLTSALDAVKKPSHPKRQTWNFIFRANPWLALSFCVFKTKEKMR